VHGGPTIPQAEPTDQSNDLGVIGHDGEVRVDYLDCGILMNLRGRMAA
jgi:hypothetical protein